MSTDAEIAEMTRWALEREERLEACVAQLEADLATESRMHQEHARSDAAIIARLAAALRACVEWMDSPMLADADEQRRRGREIVDAAREVLAEKDDVAPRAATVDDMEMRAIRAEVARDAAEARIAQLEADLVLKEGQRQTFEDQLNRKLHHLRESVPREAHDAIVAQLEADKVRLAAALRQCTQYATDDSAVAAWRNDALASVGDVLTPEERATVECWRHPDVQPGLGRRFYFRELLVILDRIAPPQVETL